MFPLSKTTLPTDAESLRQALEEGLRRIVTTPGEIVAIDDRCYPRLAAIRVSLDGAAVTGRAPLTTPIGDVTPALQVDQLEIHGSPVHIQGAAINLNCHAREVSVGQGRDRDGNLLLLLQRAAEGSVEIAVSIADLQDLVKAAAKAATSQQGITIDDVRIELSARGDRALDVVVHVRAKKLFLSATVRISGSAEIDEHLIARVSGLTCTGDGTLGSLACGFLNPYLQRFNEKELPLMVLPMAEVTLSDLRVAVGADLIVTAEFGA